jgi:hypothetical protein
VSFTIHCIRRAPDVHSVLSSSVLSYLRSYLTADSRTSPVPAIFHFYFHFYYFIILMFERFMICIVSFHFVCRLRYTTSGTKSLEHPYYILHFYSSSCIHPVCILHSSRLHPVCIPSFIPSASRLHPVIHPAPNPFFHLRYYLTFGTILPRILEQVLCLRYSTSFSFFITFHFSMFERFMICIVSFSYCVSFTIQYLCTPIPAPHPSIHPGVYPVYVRHPIPSFIFGRILPSVRSYR